MANPRSLLSVTTLSGSVQRDMASGRHSRGLRDRDTGTRNRTRKAARKKKKRWLCKKRRLNIVKHSRAIFQISARC